MVADALSRNVNAVTIDAMDLAGIARLQLYDTEILDYTDRLK